MLALARSFFRLGSSPLLFLSVLPLRDTDQVNRAHHTTLHPRERLVVSPFWRSRPLVFLFLLVFISLTATFRFGQLAI